MSWLDKLGGFLRREASDIGEMADAAKARLDQELTERETELAMTPTERIDHLQRQAAATDERFDELVEKAERRAHIETAEAEVAEAAGESSEADAAEVAEMAEAAGESSETEVAEAAEAAGESSETAEAEAADQPVDAPDGTTEPDHGDQAGQADQNVIDLAEAVGAEPVTSVEASRSPAFDKTPAQLKYEQARADAEDLLDELRGELEADGDI